jgi:C-terminal binding protein
MILNVPDYGTTEVAGHAMELSFQLWHRLLLHLKTQRDEPLAGWHCNADPLVRRSSGGR